MKYSIFDTNIPKEFEPVVQVMHKQLNMWFALNGYKIFHRNRMPFFTKAEYNKERSIFDSDPHSSIEVLLRKAEIDSESQHFGVNIREALSEGTYHMCGNFTNALINIAGREYSDRLKMYSIQVTKYQNHNLKHFNDDSHSCVVFKTNDGKWALISSANYDPELKYTNAEGAQINFNRLTDFIVADTYEELITELIRIEGGEGEWPKESELVYELQEKETLFDKEMVELDDYGNPHLNRPPRFFTLHPSEIGDERIHPFGGSFDESEGLW